ncbi:unnamed protein product [Microthlaspi erraticum]|uniref:Uncharacterized protein n=1 Tax=Microthlaspi erraticum TaxID=1685480 RepID=A0A6D2I0S6_9BRAS|nr:unnamed protein product [Microthlaspi erraticum]
MYQVKQPFTFSQETNPAQTGEKVDVALKKYMEEQRLITKNLYEKLDHMFGDLSSKFGSLSTYVQKLEVQIAQTAEAAKKQNEGKKKKMSLRTGTNRRDTVGNQEELTREGLKASHYKDDVRDDHGVTTPPQDHTEPENGEAKGIICPSATLHHD